jgi:hypothetical protein
MGSVPLGGRGPARKSLGSPADASFIFPAPGICRMVSKSPLEVKR